MAASGSRKVIIAALIGNGLIALIKFVAAAITGSSAMLSEGIHSVVDTGNQCLLLFGIRQSKKPPDAQFPFGYGKEIYFWGFVVSILIFGVGAGFSIFEGVNRVLHPHHIENPRVNYIVLGLAFAFEGVVWWVALREFLRVKGRQSVLQAVHRSKDPSVFIVLFEDSAALLGLVVAFLGVYLGQVTGIAAFDGIAAIVIGVILAATAGWLAYETKSLLIGERANVPVVEGIRELVVPFPGVRRVNEVLTLQMGPEFILVNLSVDFIDTMPAVDLEKVIGKIDRSIKDAYPNVKRVFVEAERRPTSNGEPADPGH